jgi:hypothetical protein
VLRLTLAGSAALLALYFAASIRLFGGDRVAELFDSSRMVSSALAGQVRSEVSSWLEELRLIAEDSGGERGGPGAFTRQLLAGSQKIDVAWLQTGSEQGAGPSWTEVRKDSWNAFNVDPFRESFADLVHSALSHEVALKLVDLEADDRYACQSAASCAPVVLVAFAAATRGGGARRFVIAVVEAAELIRIFGESPALKAFLVNPAGVSLLGSDPFAEGAAMDFSAWAFFGKLKSGKLREGAEETVSEGQAPMLVSYAPVGLGSLNVVSIASKASALRAMQVPLWKFAFFGCVLLGLAGFGTVAGSRWALRL